MLLRSEGETQAKRVLATLNSYSGIFVGYLLAAVSGPFVPCVGALRQQTQKSTRSAQQFASYFLFTDSHLLFFSVTLPNISLGRPHDVYKSPHFPLSSPLLPDPSSLLQF